VRLGERCGLAAATLGVALMLPVCAMRGRLEPERPAAQADAADAQLETLRLQGRMGSEEALRFAERAVALREDLPDELALSGSLEHLAAAYVEASRIDAARAPALRALGIRERNLGPEHPLVARALYQIGRVLELSGEFPEALEIHERALRIRERTLAPDDPSLADSLNSIGNLHIVRRELDVAQRCHERALAIREKAFGPEDSSVAKSLSNLALISRMRGDYARALSLNERVLALTTAASGPAHWTVAYAMFNEALTLDAMGGYERARELLEQAIRIDERSGASNWESAVARTLTAAARVSLHVGDLPGARASAERALAILERVAGPDSIDLARGLERLAEVLAAQGETTAALAVYARALPIEEKRLGKRNRRVAMLCLGLARAHLSRSDPASASRWIARARSIVDGPGRENDPDFEEILIETSRLEEQRSHPKAALATALRAAELAARHWRRVARALTEQEALDYQAVQQRAISEALGILMRHRGVGAFDRTWDAVIRARAVTLDEIRTRRPSAWIGSAGPDVGPAWERLETASRRLANLVGAEPRTEDLRVAIAEREIAERDLAALSSRFRREQDWERSGLAEVRRRIRRDAALLAFVRVRGPRSDRYAGFVLQGDSGVVRFRSLGSGAAIDALVDRWWTLARTPPRDLEEAVECSRVGAELRRVVWDPFVRDFGEAHEVLVVPDGSLHSVNLLALPAADGRFLVETAPTVAYLGAERDLLRPQAPPGRGLLVVGGPDFDAGPSAVAGASRVPFPALPGAREEAREVRSLWLGRGAAVLAVGAAASAPRFLEEAPGKLVIHIATHAYAPQPSAYRGSWRDSGLALSGANRGDGGLLAYDEIAGLDLGGVEWVVLSGCGTALGSIRNEEGVLGIRRAFQIAGARTLILSLWPVEDQWAREWARHLYDSPVTPFGAAQAVRRASLELLQTLRSAGITPHPALWGAFVAVGEGAVAGEAEAAPPAPPSRSVAGIGRVRNAHSELASPAGRLVEPAGVAILDARTQILGGAGRAGRFPTARVALDGGNLRRHQHGGSHDDREQGETDGGETRDSLAHDPPPFE